MSRNLTHKTNLFFLFIGVFSFLFLWDIKTDFFEFRYLIILPLFTTILIFYSSNPIKILADFGIPILIFIHLVILSFFLKYNLNERDFYGLIFFTIIFFVVTKNTDSINRNLHTILNIFLIIFIIGYLVFFLYSNSSFVFSCYNGWFFRTKFIFLENSHFAIISVPIINYYSLYFSEHKIFNKKDLVILFFAIVFMLISYSNFSTTFLVGLALSQMMILFKKYSNPKFFFFSVYVIIVCVITLFSYEQCSERSFGAIKPLKNFYFFKKSQNLSENEILKIGENKQFNKKFIDNYAKFRLKEKKSVSMSVETFVVSLEITWKSLFDKPFGVGFNKYYLSHSDYINKILLSDPHIKKNNIMDGSTNISKLITEFGIFGILIILSLLIFYFRNKKIKNLEFFLLSLISMQFLRGVGYFNGGFLFAYLLIFYKLIYYNNLNFMFIKQWQKY
tara:strand:+ start:1746 stop:3086 length:1341 start_codon:yes stop_codon:yes gene_type:complete